MHLVISVMRKGSLHRITEYYAGVGAGIISSITVVDFDPTWSTSRRAVDSLRSYPHTYIAVPAQRHFNKSVGLNIGITTSPDAMLLMCDADVMIDASTLLQWNHAAGPDRCSTLERVYESIGCGWRPAPGMLLAHKSAFVAVKGYSNSFQGWGKEDRDILRRLALSGVTVKTSGCGVHLSHGEDERTRNYYVSDRQEMRNRNAQLFEERTSRDERYGTLDEDAELTWEIYSHVERSD